MCINCVGSKDQIPAEETYNKERITEGCLHTDVSSEIQKPHGEVGSKKTQIRKRYFFRTDHRSRNVNNDGNKELQRIEEVRKKQSTERVVRFGIPRATEWNPKTEFSTRQSANARHFEISFEDDLVRRAALAKFHLNTEQAMRAAFASILISKLKQVKRDQEVRETLKDCLGDFHPYSPRHRQRPRRQRRCGRKQSDKSITSHRVHWGDILPKNRSNISLELQENQQISNQQSNQEYTMVGYCYGADSIPFITRIRGSRITLAQFKTLFTRKGEFRYFFKNYNSEFGTETVYEEIVDDEEVLPLWDGKIFAILEEV